MFTNEDNKTYILEIDFEGTKDKYLVVKNIEELVKIRDYMEESYG